MGGEQSNSNLNVDDGRTRSARRYFARWVALGRGRRRPLLIRDIVAITGVALLLLGFGIYSQHRATDEQRTDTDLAAVLTAADQLQQSDPSLAAQLNLVAWRMRPGDPAVRSRLLASETTPLVTVTPAGQYAITELAAQPSGHTLASLAENGDLRLWDTTDQKHPHPLPAQLTGIGNVVLSPAAAIMATSSAKLVAMGDEQEVNTQHAVTLWDISTPAAPRQLTSWPFDTEQANLAFTPDGRTLATQTLTELRLWDVSNPAAPILRATKPLRDGLSDTDDGVDALRFSPDGRLLTGIIGNSSARTSALQLWDVTNLSDPVLIDPALTTAADGPLRSGLGAIAFRPDSKLLAVGITPTTTTGQATVQLWDIADPAHPHLTSSRGIDHSSLTTLDFSPDGHLLASAGGTSIIAWNVIDPATPTRMIDNLAAGPGTCHDTVRDDFPCYPSPNAVSFTADGRGLFAGVATGDIQSWSLPTASTPTVLDSSFAPAFSSDATRMLTKTDESHTATLWDIRNPQAPRELGRYTVDPRFVWKRFGANGNELAEIDVTLGILRIADLSDPAHVTWPVDWKVPDFPAIRTWNFSPDFRLLATTDQELKTRLWDLTDPAHPKAAGADFAVANGSTVVFGADDKTMIKTETTSGSAHHEDVTTLWSLQDLAHPKQIAELQRQPSPSYTTLTFSPDLRTMVVADYKGAQRWDIGTPAHPRKIGAAIATATGDDLDGFSSDYRTLITDGFDGTIRISKITDPADTTPIATLTESGVAVGRSTLSPDNRHLGAVAADTGTLFLWDLDEQHAVDRICATTGGMWTETRWRQVLPQLPYQPPCH